VSSRVQFQGQQVEGEPVTVSVGILGTKLGMTQIFDEAGVSIPVTVIQAGPCTVTQVKTKETDGYFAIQVGYGEVKPKALNRPLLGHLAKSSAPALRHLNEYHTDSSSDYALGQQIKADIFSAGQIVDVVGTSIGRGFAGNQKRNNFARGPHVTRFQKPQSTWFNRCWYNTRSCLSR
jgi:large subunit ribosomal protein L3